MEGVIALLFILGAVALWIVSAIQMNKYGKSKGVKKFFLMLLLFAGIVGLLFLVIVYPVLNCSGFFCGLVEILVFFGASYLSMVILPIIMLTVMVRSLKKDLGLKESTEIIDTL